MKTLFLILLFSHSLFAGYSFNRTITVDKTKVPNTNQTDFPVLISGTYTYLKTVGNGGNVTNSSGFDIIFTSDAACASVYNFEIERYIATTGEVLFWVKIPTVTTATNTVFYMCYGNGSIATFQGNITGTWEPNFLRVYHVPNGTVLTTLDSTSNAANGTLSNVPTATVGQLDGGVSFSNSRVTASATGLPTTGSAFTASAWVKTSSGSSQFFLSWGLTGVAVYLGYGSPANKAYFGDGSTLISSTTNVNNGAWHYISATYNGSNSRRLYFDGIQEASDANSVTITSASDFAFGGDINLGTFNCVCSTDEVRITSVVRSADWIATEYNNQSSPSTFYTVGSAIAMGGGGRLLLLGVGD